jgi:glycosyltransferase involved in cell wall biosynthesis
MKILLIMDPYIRVPPEHYGGIERVIADLAEGLSRAGHDITLWAAPG